MNLKKIFSIMAIALTVASTTTTLGQAVYAAEKSKPSIQQQIQSQNDSASISTSKASLKSSVTDAGEIAASDVRLRTSPGLNSPYYKRLLQPGETFSLAAHSKKVDKDGYTWVHIDVVWATGWVAEKYVVYYA